MSALEVRPGQVWADNDKRAEGRTVRVDRVDGSHAHCTVVTNRTELQEALDTGQLTAWGSVPKDTRGTTARIRLDRFRPTSTGYRLVQDAEADR